MMENINETNFWISLCTALFLSMYLVLFDMWIGLLFFNMSINLFAYLWILQSSLIKQSAKDVK